MIPEALLEVLADAQRIGLLGPGPIQDHVEHAVAWAGVLEARSFIDLGSGAGVPGLVLATLWPEVDGVLLDGQARRAAWLKTATGRLDLGSRVSVLEGRAETVGHDARYRERFELVVARGFGTPAITAECGSSFAAVGGSLSISEPPGSPARWPDDGLIRLGLGNPRRVVHEGRSFVILPKTSPLATTFPRRQARMKRTPLW